MISALARVSMMSDPATEGSGPVNPYMIEILAAEHVRSLHEEAAARRLARLARRAAGPQRAAGPRRTRWARWALPGDPGRSGGGNFPSQFPPPDRWATRE